MERTGELPGKEFKTAGEMLLEEALLYLASDYPREAQRVRVVEVPGVQLEWSGVG